MVNRVLVVVAAVTVCGTAWAASYDANGSSWTAVSGFGSNHKSTTGASRGIYEIGVKEKTDDPVRIIVRTTSLNDLVSGADNPSSSDQALDLRNPNDSSLEKAAIGKDHALVAVQVCTNGANDTSNRKIKGLRIWGRRMTSQGKWGTQATAEFKRPNCQTWETKVSCATDTFAHRLRAYYVIALECRRVVP
jgi:hypothetical protein